MWQVAEIGWFMWTYVALEPKACTYTDLYKRRDDYVTGCMAWYRFFINISL